MEVFPIDSPDGHQYLLRFGNFESLPIELDIKVVDISLISESEVATINNIRTLNQISTTVFDFLDKNDVILYYYCSDDPIFQRKNREEIPPQQYRSKLFLTLFNKIIRNHKEKSLVNKSIVLRDKSEGDHYIHLIAESKYSDKMDKLVNYMNEAFEK